MPYRFEAPHSPYTGTIAALIQQEGQQQAEGVRQSGNAWAGAIQNIGNAAGQIPQQIQQQKAQATEAESNALKLAQQKRSVAAQEQFGKAISSTPRITVDGVPQLDVENIVKQAGPYAAEFMAAAPRLKEFNDSLAEVGTARKGALVKGAAGVIASGNRPDVALAVLDTYKDMHLYPPEMIDQWKAHLDTPENVEKAMRFVITSIAGPQKAERGAPGSVAVDPITHQPIEGSQVPDPKADAAATLAAERQAETTRHDKESERIQALSVGRAEAAAAESKRHNLAVEDLEKRKLAPFETDGSGGRGASPTLPEGQRNEDYLKTLPTGTADKVKALVEGRLSLPSRFTKGDLYWQGILDAAVKYDPSFDAVNYNSRSKTRQGFTSGKSSQTINALNTVTQHLDKLSTAVDGLNNTWSPAYNSVANFLSRQSGNDIVTTFETSKKAVVDELTRVWRQTGGTEADIKSWSDVLGAANSPKQLKSAIAEMAGLIEGKLGASESQYQQGMGTSAVSVITPDARKTLDKLKAGVAAKNPADTIADGTEGTVDGKPAVWHTNGSQGPGWYGK